MHIGKMGTMVMALTTVMALTQPVQAQRDETITTAQIVQLEACPLTPKAVLDLEQKKVDEFFGTVIASLFAGIAGDLVKSGFNALGDALEAASKEQGIVAEGTTGFRFGMIDPPGAKGPTAVFRPTSSCLVFFIPGKEGTVEEMMTSNELSKKGELKFGNSDTEENLVEITKLLNAVGINKIPSLYMEIPLISGREGFFARPSLIWYRSPLSGAEKRDQMTAELHLLFATPGFDAKAPGIGDGFAGARISLPSLRPGDVLGWEQLRNYRSVWLPNRPTTGLVDSRLQAMNAAKSLAATRKAELAAAAKGRAAAQRAVEAKPSAETKEALIVAQENFNDADVEFKAAVAALPSSESERAGATNAQVRFVLIKDANKFGLALAKALKGQAETAQKAVKDALTSTPPPPPPAWSASDTGYLAAMIDVETKTKSYDAAVVSGDADNITKTSGELRIAKAKANEAAISANKHIPYPGLLAGL